MTAIVIEPYWGTAAYLADEYLDAVCNTGYTIQGVKQLGKQFDEQTITIDGSTQTVYTNMTDALTALSGSTVYDNAVVLVGNFHQSSVPSGDKNKSFTMMSVDLNHDNEPDYSYIYNHN